MSATSVTATASAIPMATPSAWRRRWDALSGRERGLLMLSMVTVALALLWSIALAPALHTLRSAPARHAQLDAQLQHMRTFQAQAQALQATPTLNSTQAQRSLQNTLAEQLGSSAKIQIKEERAHISLQKVPASTLAAWLTQARSNAHTTPVQMQLTRLNTSTSTNINTSANGNNNSNSNTEGGSNINMLDGPARWSGTLVLALPTALPAREAPR